MKSKIFEIEHNGFTKRYGFSIMQKIAWFCTAHGDWIIIGNKCLRCEFNPSVDDVEKHWNMAVKNSEYLNIEAEKLITKELENHIGNDPVEKPAHYTFGKIEVIDAIEDWKLPFHLANCVKYIARAGRKDPTKVKEDLKKAVWYLNRYIDKVL